MMGMVDTRVPVKDRAGGNAPAPRDGGEPLWLTAGRWPLFAWVHEPLRPGEHEDHDHVGHDGAGAAEPPDRPFGAVVLCPPLLGEHLSAHGLQRMVARALADRGLVAVRFDYEGTGDSGGPTGGPGRLAAWLDGVDQAVALARARCRGPLTLLGVRSGALVAAHAAVRRRDVDALVLWDPWKSGRAFLRRQRALQALRLAEPVTSGTVEVPGFTVDASTAEAIESLRLPGTLPVRRALHVVRPPAAGDGLSLAVGSDGPLARAGADLLCAADGEQEACFEVDPLRREVPAATAAMVVDWVVGAVEELQRAGRRRSVPVPAPGRAIRPAVRSAATPRIVATRPVGLSPAAPGEGTVVERVLALGPHHLFAIETVPVGWAGDGSAALAAHPAAPANPPAAPAAPAAHPASPAPLPTVVFLSSGTDSHVGPTRLWVTVARRLAATGARCVRVDLSGLGDSPARAGHPEGVMRAPEAFDDVADVVRALGDPRNTVLAGLCSGAYQALESALELHPRGVVGINPVLRFTPPEVADGGAVSPRRRLCELRPVWVAEARRVLPDPVGRAMASARALVGRWRPARRSGATWIDELAAAEVDVYCVCGEDEARQLAAFGLDAPVGDRMRIEVIPDLDHGLGVAGQRDEVTERVVEAIRRMLGAPALVPGRSRPQGAARLASRGQAAAEGVEGRAKAGGVAAGEGGTTWHG